MGRRFQLRRLRGAADTAPMAGEHRDPCVGTFYSHSLTGRLMFFKFMIN